MGKKWRLQVKFSVVFIMVCLLLASAFVAGLYSLRTQVSRNEAAAVVDQVIAFRAWVAQTGMVWVDRLAPPFNDYLAKQEAGEKTYYGKNPALATRELSTIANKAASRATFRFTSDDYRQRANAPDDFEAMAIQAFEDDPGRKFVETYEGGEYRYARPILIKKGCLRCHGDPKDAPKAVIEKYGDKKAFGYKIGQVRGIVSVRLPALGLTDVGRALVNPFSIGLIVLALALNVFFTYRVVIRRLVRLTRDAEAIARGKLSTKLDYTLPSQSNDELDHLCHAVNLLQRSLVITFKRLKQQMARK